MASKRKRILRKPARTARGVVAKNKALKKTYELPIPTVHILRGSPLRVLAPADGPVVKINRLGWMEYLFGVDK